MRRVGALSCSGCDSQERWCSKCLGIRCVRAEPLQKEAKGAGALKLMKDGERQAVQAEAWRSLVVQWLITFCPQCYSGSCKPVCVLVKPPLAAAISKLAPLAISTRTLLLRSTTCLMPPLPAKACIAATNELTLAVSWRAWNRAADESSGLYRAHQLGSRFRR